LAQWELLGKRRIKDEEAEPKNKKREKMKEKA
jgi:hypothetical protein